MRLYPSDPDIQTLLRRIERGDLDLQPDFQRGEVWPSTKKQRLIDSILRQWHIPPVHVISVDNSGRQQVLDGQQRLASIRDFADGKFPVDGSLPPKNEAITSLHGARFNELDSSTQRRFLAFPIRVLQISDFDPGEPGELFFRLNQPTNLTSAEQRNAFFGTTREQIRTLVGQMPTIGLDRDTIGFSNSRMAYDDVLARACATIEIASMNQKLTASMLSDRYRESSAFSSEVVDHCADALGRLSEAIRSSNHQLRFNKATLFSWILFFHGLRHNQTPRLSRPMGHFIDYFSTLQAASSRSALVCPVVRISPAVTLEPSEAEVLLRAYSDRSTARVADATSVLQRDFVIWTSFLSYTIAYGSDANREHPKFRIIQESIRSQRTRERPTDDNPLFAIVPWDRWGELV